MADLLPTVFRHYLRVAARTLKGIFCGAHERKTLPAKSSAPAQAFKKAN